MFQTLRREVDIFLNPNHCITPGRGSQRWGLLSMGPSILTKHSRVPLIWGDEANHKRVGGEARILVVGSGVGVSEPAGKDQSQDPLSVTPRLWPTLNFLAPSFYSFLPWFKCI